MEKDDMEKRVKDIDERLVKMETKLNDVHEFFKTIVDTIKQNPPRTGTDAT